ncbi:hypothetical protein PC9H_005064 [Pleurotus ostreatus]|uniref:NmrA-like domain-containing protein n=1 Tax=Pleurotus ostreatus TaxID=5322 RepID=A0A8H7DSK8_PLEOS|nr:uncharacterized protein PC9H_005064 [Pleurotus ostreatus]KAF7433116.1 hypothetical protein PC9H_005064 [Pleurotus ostreatus]KAJ8698254.1 hypothetical protein PTI98_004985 [Pleurotus ostreatus]
MSGSKLILVIGATGAQGIAVIDALLSSASDGSPSPYSVRALTRDPSSQCAQELAAKGVECVQGAFDNLRSVAAAFKGVYGAWVNTDGFTVGEQKEIYAGLKIFEIAKRTPSVRHYVWSNLDYGSKKSGYSLEHKCEHYDGKGRVAEFMKQQNSGASGMTWSIVTTGPYFELLYTLCGPFNKRADGTFVFASVVQDGHVPFIALSDLGWWARYTFDHRTETSGKDLEVASDMVGWDYLAKTFTEVTGHPAIHKRQSQDEWWLNWHGAEKPIANERGTTPDGSTSGKENFSSFWRLFRDDIIKRDLGWIRGTHPTGQTLESWMREKNYQGALWLAETAGPVLKNDQDGKNIFVPNLDVMSQL